jgi:hypothetical protein
VGGSFEVDEGSSWAGCGRLAGVFGGRVAGWACGVVGRESTFVDCRVEGVVVEVEIDRSRLTLGVGVGVGVAAAEVLRADPGRGGGCMGVCFDFGPRKDPERASAGIGGMVGSVLAFPFCASCASSSAR